MVGPSTDGNFVRQVAQLELASGNYAKNIDSLLITHVADESTIFVDGHISTDAEFVTFFNTLFPAYALASGLNAQVENFYPNVSSANSPYASESARTNALLRDSSMTCNARALMTAYAPTTPVYSGQYSITPGWHGTDLLPIFWSDGLSNSPLGTALEIAVPLFTSFANKYKSFFTSFARAADPNTYRDTNIFTLPWTINWPTVSGLENEQTSNVMNAGDFGFGIINDDQLPKSHCDFWTNVLAAATIEGGYSPPGSVVGSNLVSGTAGASDNY